MRIYNTRKAVIELAQDSVLDYILKQTGAKPTKKGDKILLNPCPICGHKDHFYVYPETSSFYSFSECCSPPGGTIIDAMMLFEGLSLSEAMRRVHGDSPPPDRRKAGEIKKLAELLTKNVEGFFDACIEKYKFFKETEQELLDAGFEHTNPLLRWARTGRRFYDRVTDEFISGDFKTQVRLMRNHQNEYFFKLKPGGAAIE